MRDRFYESIDTQLLKSHLLSQDQLDIALMEEKKSGKRFEKLILEMGFITEKALSEFISQSTGVETFSLSNTFIDPEAVHQLPKSLCDHHKVILTSYDQETGSLAMCDIHDVMAIDAVRKHLKGLTLHFLVATESELIQAIDLYYGYETSLNGILKEIKEANSLPFTPSQSKNHTSPTVRLVTAIILDAVKKKASDIHFEPEGNFLRIRYRIDGMLTLFRTLHISYWPPICVRLKIISEMNITNSLLPQSGGFTSNLGARDFDFRVSSQPIIHGENIVIRILDRTHTLLSLEELGYGTKNNDFLKRILKSPAGMVVVTGPTGSGKTTTLYSILSYMNSPTVNIMTLEEPVEYRLPWIRQTEVKDPGGVTFAKGVRSILRQDPDIILIGEVRDEDTATMALRSSMTGHQVFTTLHTNDVFGVVSRLQNLGLDPSILAGNMICSIAQRLLRKLCPHCKVPASKGTSLKGESLGVYDAAGCNKCHQTGYAGRTAVVEILHFTETMNDMISSQASRAEFKKIARQNGFISMVEHGLKLVEKGITSLSEFERVLGVHT